MPEQGVERAGEGYALTFRQRRPAEDGDAALSLATNLAVAAALQTAGTGLFRTMPEPDERAVRRLRLTARAFGVDWPDSESLADLGRRLHPEHPCDAALMLAIRRSSVARDLRPLPTRRGAVARRARGDVRPRHGPVAPPGGPSRGARPPLSGRQRPEPSATRSRRAFARLPEVMEQAETKAAHVDRAAIDLVETVVLRDRVGDEFAATVIDATDDRARIQLADPPVRASVRVADARPGEDITVRLSRGRRRRPLGCSSSCPETRHRPGSEHASGGAAGLEQAAG